MRGQERMHIGDAHEQAVAERLREVGWHVEPFGQGLFSEKLRSALQHHQPPVLIRWLPDMIATRRGRVVLVEAKSRGSNDTPNHSLEIACLTSMQVCEACWSVPVYLVWSDFTVSIPRYIEPNRVELHPRVKGSCTPFVLVPKSQGKPFSYYFGSAEGMRSAG